MEDRRLSKFPERLSTHVVWVAAIGAFLVLLDPRVAFTIAGQTIAFGGEGFSAELKGAVITIMLIGGWTAVTGYWLGTTDSGQKTQESMSRIAEQSAPVAASAVLAATGGSAQMPNVPAGTVNVAGENVNVTENPK